MVGCWCIAGKVTCEQADHMKQLRQRPPVPHLEDGHQVGLALRCKGLREESAALDGREQGAQVAELRHDPHLMQAGRGQSGWP